MILSRIWKLRDRMRKKGSSSHVLMFHDVYSAEKAKKEKAYSVSIEQFRQIIGWHQNKGYDFISIDEMLKKRTLSKKQCLITFDDGKDNVNLVIPILHEYKIPFCIYVITSKIGKEGYLTKEQLKILSKDLLCTIGSHTHSHPYTRYLSRKELISELEKSKRVLEKIVGKTIDHFAFPYGTPLACSVFDIRYVRRTGYKSSAFTKQTPLPFLWMCPYYIPRFDASRKDILEAL